MKAPDTKTGDVFVIDRDKKPLVFPAISSPVRSAQRDVFVFCDRNKTKAIAISTPECFDSWDVVEDGVTNPGPIRVRPKTQRA